MSEKKHASLPFLDLPIVLAPMGGFAGAALVAAVCNARGFGILPCAYLSAEQIAAGALLGCAIVGVLGGEVTKTFVVLGGHDHVLLTG